MQSPLNALFRNFPKVNQADVKPDNFLPHRIQLGSLYFNVALYSVVNILVLRRKGYSPTHILKERLNNIIN